jgi:hypothetical protein
MSPLNKIEMSPFTTISMEVVDVRGLGNEQERTKKITCIGTSEDRRSDVEGSSSSDGSEL